MTAAPRVMIHEGESSRLIELPRDDRKYLGVPLQGMRPRALWRILRFGLGAQMTRAARRRMMFGVLAVAILSAVAVVVAFTGWLGPWAKAVASGAWIEAQTLADQWYATIDKLGKLTGFFITIGSGAYAIYQKLYFAEFNMHVRLREFQARVEERLKKSSKEVDKATIRPGPSRPFETPIFTDATLNPVLKRMRWGKRPKADESLEDTLAELQNQLKSWEGQKREYELRKAQASLLKGAIAAARAATKTGEDARKDNVEALGYFQEAFQLSQESDTEALEYVGHQQVRLGDHQPALATFQQLAAIEPEDRPSLLRARALKFQGEVYECRPQPNYHQANLSLLGAVAALPADAPLLEKAEIQEMHGRVREKAGIALATQSFTEAERFYQRIIDRHASEHTEKAIADAGLKRVREALQRLRLKPIQPTNGSGAPTTIT
jgi:tetratricopeptide (TPR) repeat protein